LLAVVAACVQVGEDFAAAADSYVRRYLLRGIPSLFSDLKPLYADSAKAAALQQLFDSYAASLRSSGSLPALIRQADSTSSSNGPLQQQPANGSSSSSGEDNPLTWVLHYLAQHYDRLGDREAALKLNADALELAPGVIELLLARARILKHTGKLHLFSAVWCHGHWSC
jgi:peptide alpha-N-acetyltransferase